MAKIESLIWPERPAAQTQPKLAYVAATGGGGGGDKELVANEKI